MSRIQNTRDGERSRMRIVGIIWIGIAGIFVVRLFFLQTVDHKKYSDQAAGARTLNQIIRAERGQIYGHDARTGQDATYPIALNRDKFTLISDNRKIKDTAGVAKIIAQLFSDQPNLESELVQKLSQSTRAYQPLVKDIKQEIVDALRALIASEKIEGLYFDRESARLYPEHELLGQISGFVVPNDAGMISGKYGIEGFFDTRLRGTDGFVKTEKDPFGGWIPVADRAFADAKDGDAVILTIDRIIQLKLCDALIRGVAKFGAKSGSGIIMDPKTGAIFAMCNVPQFDPNEFQKVKNQTDYNNNAIFRAYEPGSVFKAFTMSAALDAGVVTPDTTYVDPGIIRLAGFTIHNAADKSWGKQTMSAVIRESLNTGTVFASGLLGLEKFKKYVEAYGFGKNSGIELKTEENGTIKSLAKKGVIFMATASFGQGITTTPLQLITGYAAIANKGVLLQPHVVYGWKKFDGTSELTESRVVRRVVSEHAAAQITEMMRAVVDEGHGKLARVPGYSIAGKTGTAQIPGKYSDANANNHTFVGFGPTSDPKFVMLILYEEPHARFAESTAVPTFGEVAKFLVEYLGIQPDKPL